MVMTCALCGDHSARGTSIMWANGRVQWSIADLCPVCQSVAGETVFAAVRQALAQIDSRHIPYGINHAAFRWLQDGAHMWMRDVAERFQDPDLFGHT